MRITTVIAELGVGGAEVVAVTVAAAAARAGHDVTVASGPGHRVVQLRSAGVAHVPVPLVGRSPFALLRALTRLRGISRPDLVHAHNPKATLVARLALGPGVPLLSTLHGVSEEDLPRAARILRAASTRVAVVSPHLAENLARADFPRERIDVVPNAVAPPAPYSRERARAELGLPEDTVVGLCLARMVDQKRHDLLIEAWSSLHAPAVLLLAGDGPNRPQVVRAVERSRLGGTVRLLGERSDVPRLVAASDFLVLPTEWEGLPISVLEALASGLPVVASRVEGLAGQLAGAVRFVDPGSATALATGIADVIGSRSLRAHLAARGRSLAAERFAVDAMVDRYLDHYADLAGSHRPALTGSGGRR